jgi:F-type H+-transporting ATPase subunit a
MYLSPLESFSILNIIGITSPLLNIDYQITNNSLFLIISLVLLLILMMPNNSLVGNKIIPSNVSIMSESLWASGLTMARNSANNQAYLPLILSLFGTILLSNVISNVPYSYASASSLSFSLGLSVTIFIAVTALALNLKGITFWSTFVPASAPLALVPLLIVIELISYLARALSLGIRLFANLVAGHTLLHIVSSMSVKILLSGLVGALVFIVPMVLLVMLTGLELAVALIQAYVFVVLASIYINEAQTALA